MAIEVNNITSLKNRNKGVGKLSLNDSDYVLRDKSKEIPGTNTFDITADNNKYQEELSRLKADARREVEAELLSSGFMDKLKADIRADIKAEETKKTGAK